MELSYIAAIFSLVSNDYDFIPEGGSESDRMVGTSHTLTTLDFEKDSVVKIKVRDEALPHAQGLKRGDLVQLLVTPTGNRTKPLELKAVEKVLGSAFKVAAPAGV